MLIKKEVQKQHVDYYKKILLRKNLLSYLSKEGDIYVPFIGDGDIAFDLYKYRKIYGADLDPERVKAILAGMKDAGWSYKQITIAFGSVGAEAQAINRADSIEKAVRQMTEDQAEKFEARLEAAAE